MVINHKKTKDWLKLAFNNLDRVTRNFKVNDYADCIFRIQLSIEQLQKSLLFLMGLQFKKTHEPSKIIESFASSERTNLEEEKRIILLNIANIAKKLEQEETKTRYGVIRGEDLIAPEDEYDINKAEKFLSDLNKILGDIIKLFEDLQNFSDEIEELLNYKKLISELITSE